MTMTDAIVICFLKTGLPCSYRFVSSSRMREGPGTETETKNIHTS